MKSLYQQAFELLYRWNHKKLKGDDKYESNVHYSKLHMAPLALCLYHDIIEERLKALTN